MKNLRLFIVGCLSSVVHVTANGFTRSGAQAIDTLDRRISEV
jgi:hypothetical protein